MHETKAQSGNVLDPMSHSHMAEQAVLVQPWCKTAELFTVTVVG